MSDVKMKLTQAQYGFLVSLSRSIPRAFSQNEEEVEDDSTVQPSSVAPVQATSPAKETEEDAGPTVDLMPEIATVAKNSDGTVVALKSSLELSFALGTVYLELFTEAALDTASLSEASLARFSLNETNVKYKMLSNGSMEAEVAIRSFTVHDTRPARLTKFREIIPATKHSGHQFMISYTQSGGSDNSSFANVAIDTPKVVFSLDPLFALLDYFTSAFKTSEQAPDEPESEKDGRDEEETIDDSSVTVATADSASASTFAFRVNVVSPTVILLANPEKIESEAVILSISQVQMAQQGTLALSVSKIGMFLCRMDKPKETIRVLDNFDITLSMDSRADNGRQVTDIDLGITPLLLRVSYRDILLINSILNRAIELSNRNAPDVDKEEAPSQHPRPPAKSAASSNRKVSRSRKDPARGSVSSKRRPSNAGLVAQVIISKETLRATIDGFQLLLIGDLHDLPLLDLKTGKFTARVKDWSSDVSVRQTS